MVKRLALVLACCAVPRVAWADGGCSGCFENGGCAWVCTVVLGFVAIPLWLVGLAACLAFAPSLRRAMPHLIALPVAYFGAWLPLAIAPSRAGLGFATAAMLLLAWYVAVSKLSRRE